MTWERHGASLALGDVMLTPVERITLVCQHRAGALFFAGSKRPVAVIVRRGDREWRLALPHEELGAAAAA